jgi:NodT family efflux transporter outer membrane factor (OMF) lipoprotein
MCVKSKAAVCALAAALTACTVGPEYQRPDVATGTGWTLTTPAAPAPELTRWWESFGDATLDRLVTTALAQNLDLKQATARIAEARALRDAAAGGRYPTLAARASVTRRRQSENGPIPINVIPGIERDQTIYEPGFDAAWEVDVFGGTRRAVEAATARVDAAVDRHHGVELAIAAETARRYFELRGTRHEIEALQAAIKASREALDLVRRQRAAGEVPEAAVAQAEAEVARVEAELPPRLAAERGIALSLSTLLGELPETQLPLLDTSAAYVELKPLPVGERADLLRRRPDVGAADRALAAATADVGVATAELFPKFRIGANGGFQALRSGDVFEAPSETFALVPLIQWRLFDGGRVRAQIRASEARVQIAALQYEGAVQAALLDAEQALTRYHFGLETLARAQTAVDAARRSYGFANDRYRAGDISLLELLDAERTLRTAEEGYASTHTATATELVALYKALGGGWQGAADPSQTDSGG